MNVFYISPKAEESEAEKFLTEKRKTKSGDKKWRRNFLGVFFVTGKTFVHLEDGGLDKVTAEEAILVEEVSHGLSEGILASFSGLAIAESQHQVVHVVELFHVGRGLPCRVGVQPCGVLLVDDDEDAFLLVGRVQGQDHHQHEVSADTTDKDRPRSRKRMKIVVEESDHRDGDGYAADPQPDIDEIVVLDIVQLLGQDVFDGVIESILDGRPVPLVDLDHLLLVAVRILGHVRLLGAVLWSHRQPFPDQNLEALDGKKTDLRQEAPVE